MKSPVPSISSTHRQWPDFYRLLCVENNNRKEMNDFDGPHMAASQILGKRLMWKQAIGMVDFVATSNCEMDEANERAIIDLTKEVKS